MVFFNGEQMLLLFCVILHNITKIIHTNILLKLLIPNFWGVANIFSMEKNDFNNLDCDVLLMIMMCFELNRK